jgi:hypothetical protein
VEDEQALESEQLLLRKNRAAVVFAQECLAGPVMSPSP